jgi:predicted glycoside hydrolase/deacetylase ChbG (UPF0249 family)
MLQFSLNMEVSHRKRVGFGAKSKAKLSSILLPALRELRAKRQASCQQHPGYTDVLALSLALFTTAFLFTACGSPTPLHKELGYQDDAIVLIVNADDVGLHADVTDATIQAMRQGSVTSGSIMVPCPDFGRTVSIWKEHPDLDFGIHLTLTCEWGHLYPWAPILPKDVVPSLFTEDGLMWPDVESLVHQSKISEVLMEAEAQIRSVLSFGVQPTHLDAHMSWYMATTEYYEGVMQLAQKYHLPMRIWQRIRTRLPWWPNNPAEMRRKGFVFPDSQASYYHIEGEDARNGLRQEKYSKFLGSLHHGVHEIAVHLAIQAAELEMFMGPKDAALRKRDYDIWTGPATRGIIQNRKIVLIGFRELYKLQKTKWPVSCAKTFSFSNSPCFVN